MTRQHGAIAHLRNGRIVALDRREFKDQAALDKFWDAAEALAGRALSWREMSAEYGIHQSAWESLHLARRAEDFRYYPKMAKTEEKPNPNPFESPAVSDIVRRQREKFTGVVDREKSYAEAAAKWRQEHEQSEADDSERAEREPVVKACRALADRLRFSPDAPLDEVRMAVNSIKQAETLGADLTEAQRMYVAVSKGEEERNKAKRIELQRQMDALKAQMGDDEPEPERPETPEPPELTPEQVRKRMEAESWAEAERRLTEMKASCDLPGVPHTWEHMTGPGVDADMRQRMWKDNLEAAENATSGSD